MRPEHARTWVEIDIKALAENLRHIQARIGDTKCAAVVKSNAYGHGMEVVAKTMADGGVAWLCVDEFHEAVTLRDAGISTPILVMGYTLPAFFKEAVERDISITLSSLQSIPENLKVHIKIDSGMHRQGFLPEEVDTILDTLGDIEGIYTHFASLDSHTHDVFSQKQLDIFNTVVQRLREGGHDPLVHASASSGALSDSTFHFHMVRLGILIYGLWPSAEMKEELEKELLLQPVLSWKSMVTEVKTVPKGEKIGYGCTFETKRETQIAVIPVGYWHGLDRGLSNKGYVGIQGKKVPIVGNISMDMTVVDVTGLEVAVGEEVMLIGGDISADDIAETLDTISYEVVTRINPQIQRVSV